MASDSFLVKALRTNPQTIRCSLSDYLALPAPVSVVFYYRQAIPKELIIQALEHVLGDFPLFAGRLVKGPEGLIIDCNNQGVHVKVVQQGGPLFDSETVEAIKPFKEQTPLLKLQLTYAQEGMAISYCWHHSLGDMATFMEFLNALSACAKGKPYPLPLIVTDRTVNLVQIDKIKKEKALRLKILGIADLLRLLKHVYSKRKCIYLHFADEEIADLRERLTHQTGLKLSRNDALCAYLLNLTTHQRRDKALYLSLALNTRSRLKLPPNLLGNYCDLVSIPIEKPDDVPGAAKEINQAVQNYLSDYFQHPQILQDWVNEHNALEKIRRLIPEPVLPEFNHLVVTNWLHFGVYSIDFGSAPPCLFLPIGRTPLPWASCIVEGQGNQGLLVTLVVPSYFQYTDRQKSLSL